MRKLSILLLSFALLFVCSVSKAQISMSKTITIINTGSQSFVIKVVEIPWSLLEKTDQSIDTGKLIVIDAATKKQLMFQYETQGKNAIQQLLIQLTLKPQQSKKIILTYGKRDMFISKTFGRFVPERKDDFAWENDKIAFRMYGKALENSPKEMAYGTDVWVKRTDRLILNERYKRGEYHIDHGDGLDYYHVGFTLGAGNMMPYINDSIYYSGNYRDYKVLDNGPLRTTFQLFYTEWKAGENKLSAVKTISLDAGSQLNRIRVEYTTTATNAIPVVAGIITRQGKGIKYLDEVNGLMVYWEPEHDKDGITGVACLFNTPIEKMIESNGQLLAKTATDTRHSITYYSGAAWSKAGDITDGKQWIKYVDEFQQQLKNPLKIVYK